MTIVASKFLPMSLDDIVQAIQDLQNSVAEVKDAISSFDNSNLDNELQNLKSNLDGISELLATNDNSQLSTAIEGLQEQLDNMQSSSDAIAELSDRVSSLEQTLLELSSAPSTEGSSVELQDISDRVDALEQTQNEFFG